MRSLVWFRADLRYQDNPALTEATKQSTSGVLGVFVYTPQQWYQHDWGSRRVAFMHRNLQALSKTLADANIPLLLKECDTFDQIPALLDQLAQQHDCNALFFNKEYEYNEAMRDHAVQELWSDKGRPVHTFDDQVLLPPGSVKTQAGGWYEVFTPFKRTWISELGLRGGVPALVQPVAQKEMCCAPGAIPQHIAGYDFSDDRDDLWLAGEKHAHQRLQDFVEQRLVSYHQCRDIPSVDGTSMLSPYLAAGVLSPRQCLHAVLEATSSRWPEVALGEDGAATWINELIWREFYRHLLVAYPRLCMYRAFKPETEHLLWCNHPGDFQAWCEGRTGFPIIDAAMQQLLQTGWMHNRLRMLTAMFLTKQLLIDWRWGEQFFMQHLVDADLASNNGGWQWSASTGTDAAPYFRIFNPWSQSKRYDPDGAFIKEMLPVLADVPASALHDPDKLAKHRPTSYPAPICDHKDARQRAIDAFKAL